MLVLALVALATIMPGASFAAEVPAGSQFRSETDLSRNWRFLFGAGEAAVAEDCDDSAWQKVDLPHSWNRLGNAGLARSASSDLRQGQGWYRTRFATPMHAPGRRFFLQFDGVGTVARVWLNGTLLGAHEGAFSSFRLDVTDSLKRRGENLLVVSADNSAPAPGSVTEHVLPLGGDFFPYGGIYRGVTLIETGPAQIDVLDHGGSGIYLTTPVASPARAEIEILTRLRNFGRPRKLRLGITIADAAGELVANGRSSVMLRGSATSETRRRLSLLRPRLWQGTADPYLYSVTVTLFDGEVAIDRVVQPLGVRSFAFDPANGFSLNGKAMPLHGASRHQDREGRGWALTDADHDEDMAIMAEMGVNAIRHAHYQHAQRWADLADRRGMIVWAELPFVNQSSLSHGEPSEQLRRNAALQLTELIRQNFNHPSIMIWAVGNEVDIGAAMDAQRHGGDGPRAKSRAMLAELDRLVRHEDPSRVTAYADCCDDTPMSLTGAERLTDLTQMAAFNRYFGWYYGTPDRIGPALDTMHSAHPEQTVAVSEYGAGGALSQHTDNPLGGPVNAFGRPHPEEVQTWVHENAWGSLKTRRYLGATWIWTMFDFASSSRQEGDGTDLNDKGLVSFDRRTRKDAFYFYKANWSADPTLHITGRRYVDRAYSVTDVKAYSSAARAMLSLNNVAVGEVECPDHICLWRNVHLSPGANRVAVSATVGGRSLTDFVQWNAPDPQQGLDVATGTLTGFVAADGRRFGSDNFFEGGLPRRFVPYGPGPKKAAPVRTPRDPELYASYREGSFRYALPLPDGRWIVTLHFAEPDEAKASTRTFDVLAQGKTVLRNFAPAREAGAARSAVVRAFPATSVGGLLTLNFVARDGDAIVSAISVRPR